MCSPSHDIKTISVVHSSPSSKFMDSWTFSFTSTHGCRFAFPSRAYLTIFLDSLPLNPAGFPLLSFFTYYYGTHAQIFHLALVTFNRFVVIALPRPFCAMWIAYLRYLNLVILLLPSALTWHIIAGGAKFEFLGDGWGINHKKFLGIRNSLYVLIVSLIVGAFNLTVNLVTLAFVLSRKKCRKDWAEIKLFILTLIVFFLHVIQAVFQMFAYVNGNNLNAANDLLNLTPFVNDLTCLSAPWLLLLTSNTFRKSALLTVKCKEEPAPESSLFTKRSASTRM
ncbi:hypothetical protein QR680_014107 [Steinernema hermaphroditum]|uniref:Serpentine receptor class gamma n=1 Tax=Steinernema hermaphroditum TaxID=289476 RepID=A0AA39I944_9BILA|nr:hypothetical protein QR680_014107 [Steinernema hermaphroditum]